MLCERVRFPHHLLESNTMHEPYDQDDEYDDDHYDYDHPMFNQNKWYFKFDVGPDTPLSKWINDIVNNFMGTSEDFKMMNIPGFPPKVFPVNSWNPNTGKGKTFQYLGSNYAGEPIWKKKYFVHNKLDSQYKLHLQSHAGYFIKQPNYYKGLFDILN
jgi:hypothetical protein